MKYSATRLEAALFQKKWITPELWRQASLAAEKIKLSTVNYLLQAQLISEQALASTLQELFALPWLSKAALTEKISPHQILPKNLERQFHCLAFHPRELILSDPTQETCFTKVSGYLHPDYQVYLAAFEDIHDILKSRSNSSTLNPHSENFLGELFSMAQKQGASDLHIEAQAQSYRIRLRVSGNLSEILELSLTEGQQLISKCKVLAKLDISEQRLPQDGRMSISLGAHQIHCRLNTCPTTQGEKLVIRLLDHYHHLAISDLGFTEAQKNLFQNAIQKPQGLILVTGPTGSGKTTTLYAALQALNSPSQNISSIEDPSEISLAGVNQINIHPEIGLDFPEVLRALLRQDPDIIMVGEIRDELTAKITLRAAQTGHLVLATMHTNHALAALTRLLQMNIQAYELQHSLLLITAQRLLRRLCPHCKTEDFQPLGCKDCHQGYLGRFAIHELLPMNENLEKYLQDFQNPPQILTLAERGQAACALGETSLAEYRRVLG